MKGELTFRPNTGTLVDILCFALSIPVIPFQLKALGYKDVASLTGWLMFAYVRPPPFAL